MLMATATRHMNLENESTLPVPWKWPNNEGISSMLHTTRAQLPFGTDIAVLIRSAVVVSVAECIKMGCSCVQSYGPHGLSVACARHLFTKTLVSSLRTCQTLMV